MFKVNKTFDVVTPESAEQGDIADSGFVWEDRKLTLRETLREIEDLRPVENWMPVRCLGRYGSDVSQSLYGTDEDCNYRTGEVTTYALHIYAHPRNMKRLGKVLAARKLIEAKEV